MDRYKSVIGDRYQAPQMSQIWSQRNQILTMRDLWISLATFERELGIDVIEREAIEEMIRQKENIDLEKIAQYEKELKHDIMAHIHAYGDAAPSARKFIHLGATSCYITDNRDLILMRESLKVILNKIKAILIEMTLFIDEYKETPTLAYTHLQAAQLTTVGKRAALWAYDLLQDFQEGTALLKKMRFRGAKGTTGSEDSFLTLFEGDVDKCRLLNERLCQKYGFENHVTVCGQTYSRKMDVSYMHFLSSLAQTFYKICNDIRLLASKGELGESFDRHQTGSSAMVYKQNPITCEKICSLCRYIMNQENCMSQTYIQQWCERTLDDSAIRRIILPETLILTECVLNDFFKLFEKMEVFENIIHYHVMEHMPYILSEKILMNGVKMGFDRQNLHERLRLITIAYTNDLRISPRPIHQNDLDAIYYGKLDPALYRSVPKNPIQYIGNIIYQVEQLKREIIESLG